ncbi:MAG: hypothetical protein K8S98_01495 [Planctomycetes bacterium]|nr:hypothetical protein [Planctomycetota bacterium]
MSFTVRSRLLASLALAVAVPAAAAQSGGFTPGDLIFSIGGPQAPFADGGTGLARIDPQSGQISVLVDFFSGGTMTQGVAYDAFRDRVLFSGVPYNGAPLGIWTTDSQGTLELLHSNNSLQFSLLSPASGGRVYYTAGGVAFTPPLRYLDATNVEQNLMDSTGVSPFSPPWMNTASAMTYDAASNSLIVAMHGAATNICSGTNFNYVIVHKLPLSADGSRMIGPESCAQFQLSTVGSSNFPAGIGTLPNGHVLLCINPNASGVVAEFLEFDPQSVSLSHYASPGTLANGIAMINGTYSTVLGKGVCVDPLAHVVRLYAAGETGDGTVLSTSAPISPAGFAPMSWTEVRPGQCGTNVVSTYCVAKTTSTGCVPAISTSGGPSASAGSGFAIECASIGVNKNGLLFYSTAGASNAPYQGGVLCVKAPIKRSAPQNSGGTTGCSGKYSIPFNALIASGQNPALVAGAQVWAQFWFRDPGDAFGTGLSDAVSFHICP